MVEEAVSQSSRRSSSACTRSLLTPMQVLALINCGLSDFGQIIRLSTPNTGVAFSEFLIPLACSVVRDNEGDVEQNDDVVCGTPRSDMACGWTRLFYRAHRKL